MELPQLQQLVADFGTPCQVYDEDMIRARAACLNEAFGTLFPRYINYFAVKALPNPHILKIMLDCGCGLDVSGHTELQTAVSLGAADRTFFSSNFTSAEDLEAAVRCGAFVNLDDPALLSKFPGELPPFICFRLNPGVGATSSETASNVLGGRDSKFGAPLDAVVEGVRTAKRRGVTSFGLHMMTGSCVLDAGFFETACRALFEAANHVLDSTGVAADVINIGGGMGVPYADDARPLDPRDVAARVHRVWCDTLRPEVAARARLCSENGRWLTGPAGVLVARCVARKSVPGQEFRGLDACMAHLMRPGMYGAYHRISVPGRTCEPAVRQHVVGQLCENNDWFARDRALPDIREGDIVLIHDTGAHGHSMGFQYNGKLRAPEVLVSSSSVPRLIRRRETAADYLATVVGWPARARL